MASIFTRIVQGEIPCHRVAETADCLAFLDIHPLAEGHTLVIPKKEIDYLFDVDDEEMARLAVFSKKVARAIKKVIPCRRVGVAVVGFEVPHAHIHLIPIDHIYDIDFSRPKLKPGEEKMADIAARIRNALEEV